MSTLDDKLSEIMQYVESCESDLHGAVGCYVIEHAINLVKALRACIGQRDSICPAAYGDIRNEMNAELLAILVGEDV